MWDMKPNIPLAVQLAKRDVPALVYDAVNLEGVAMTLPEVQTILDGITVGGHRISDQNMAINQAKAWAFIFDLVEQGEFTFDKKTALSMNRLLPMSWIQHGEKLSNKSTVRLIFTIRASRHFYKWLALSFFGTSTSALAVS